MNELIIYLAGVVLNTICAILIIYKIGKMSCSDLVLASVIIPTSFIGTVAVLIFMGIEFGDFIIWKRKEAEK